MNRDGRGEPSAGDILIGTFLILFGLCVSFAGGACTIMWLPELGRMGHSLASFSVGFLLVMLFLSVGTFASGLHMLRNGIRRARGIGPKQPSGAGGQDDGRRE